ncbi:hypothetical protein [Cylindrospermopsis raciborskii]|nr:hypothetical protein [Cylindrospermopsis raciborskii]
MNTGFSPQCSVDDAIEEIIAKYQSGELVESDRCYAVRWMKQLNL